MQPRSKLHPKLISTTDFVARAMQQRVGELGKGFRPVGMALRVALTGKKSSPDLPILIVALGARQAAQRLRSVAQHVRESR